MRRMLKRVGLVLVLFMSIRYVLTTPGLWHALVADAPLLAQHVASSAQHVQPAQSTSEATFSIMGPPTISTRRIDQILTAYDSPAAGLGQYIYDTGVRYGIDPVHVLAIFLHESTMGTAGEATKTMSPGNERCIPDRPCVDLHLGGYAQMESWQDGFAHLYALLYTGYLKGGISSRCPCVTLNQIVPVFAPSLDGNNEHASIQAWEEAVIAWRAGAMNV